MAVVKLVHHSICSSKYVSKSERTHHCDQVLRSIFSYNTLIVVGLVINEFSGGFVHGGNLAILKLVADIPRTLTPDQLTHLCVNTKLGLVSQLLLSVQPEQLGENE